MIDTSKPWFPQDFPVEEVLALVKRMPLSTDEEHEAVLAQTEDDYRIRKGGVAGVFHDLRRQILGNFGEADAEGNVTIPLEGMTKVITDVIGNAIGTLEGHSIPNTKFIIQEYAVPVMTRDAPPDYNCTPTLLEEIRPASALGDSIFHQYWAMVASEKSTD